MILSPALYFDFEDLEKELLKMIDAMREEVDYLKNLQKETLVGTVVVSLIIMAVSLKHPGFKEEREWRLIYLPGMMPDNGWLERSVETINGVPQIIYKLPLMNNSDLDITGFDMPELIYNIIIGPTSYASAMYDAFHDVLASLRVDNAPEKIIISGIPLRT